MPDYGAKYTDKAIAQTEAEIRKTYRRAKKELKAKLDDFERKFAVKNQEKQKALQEGKISEQEYKNWLTGQVFIRNQWQSKIRQVSEVMHDCNRQAVNLINNKRLDVFAENYNYMAFRGEMATGISFGLYNSQAVARLMQENPKMLPEWNIDEEKDYKWNEQKVNNIVRQGIIQGESIPQIANRLCDELVSMNENKMNMFARTAMTEAQNAGRQQQMNDAADMGIDIHKQWLATLDSRTRDSHRKLDGQEVPYNENFVSLYGEIEYPGDPDAEPADVFNCRCTMVSIYPKYEDRSKPNWREEETIDGMTYQEWKENKKVEKESKKEEKESKNAAEKEGKVHTINGMKVDENGNLVVDTEELIKKQEEEKKRIEERAEELTREREKLWNRARELDKEKTELDNLEKALNGDFSVYEGIKTEEEYKKQQEDAFKKVDELQQKLDALERPKRDNYKSEEEYEKAYEKYLDDKAKLRAAKEDAESRYYKLFSKSWKDVERHNKAQEMGLEGIKAERARLEKLSEENTRNIRQNAAERAKLQQSTKYDLHNIERIAKEEGVAYKPPKVLDKPKSEDEIIARLGGADRTEGSCASLGFCYIGQKSGIDVLDFRDGESRRLASHGCRDILREIAKETGATLHEDSSETATAAPVRLAKTMQEGKEYYFVTGRHAAIMRKRDGKIEYLELQSNRSGWKRLSDSESEDRKSLERGFRWRFGTSRYRKGQCLMMDIEDMKGSKMLQKMYGYMNTEEDKQHKGAGGGVK